LSKLKLSRHSHSQNAVVTKRYCTEVEIEVQDNYLIVRSPQSRVGWDEAFAAMTERHDDVLLDDINTTEWDQLEW